MNNPNNTFLKSNLLPVRWEFWPAEARILIALLGFWCISGLFILGSASWWVSIREMGDGGYYIKRQIIWLIASWGILFTALKTSLKTWLKISGPILFLGLILIAATLVFGSTVNGSTRWLIVGPIQIQPSELIKPFLILQAAKIFSRWSRINNDQKLFWLGIFLSLIILILKQPNLSTAALSGILIWLIALAAGVKFRSLFLTAISGISLGLISIYINPYQKLRITSFLNPWEDPQGNGYQLIQSLLAIGSGGWLGEGYGLSTQKLQYLPIQSTDFIFAVFAEEFGFIGSLMFFLFLIFFAFISLRVAIRSRTNQGKLIAIGCCTLLVGQSIMNVAVASGAMPTTGLPLPMISYGGNSLLSSLLISGLLIRTSLESTDLIDKVKVRKRKS